MKDNDVLQSIDTAHEESKCLLDSALLIKTNGLAGDTRPPTSFMNSSFGMWLYTDGLSLAKYPWFSSMVEQHQLLYEGYSKIFHGAKKGTDISESLTDFESLVKAFHDSLDEAKKEFCDDVPEPEPEPEPESNQNIESKEESSSHDKNIASKKIDKPVINAKKINQPNLVVDKEKSRTEILLEKLEKQKEEQKEASSDVSVSNDIRSQENTKQPKSGLSDEHLNIHNDLQKENQNQLELKQELIEQELSQVKDRQQLFTKTITQLDYHHLLKEKEGKLAVKGYKEKLSQNSIIKKKKVSDLKEFEIKRENTQQEFEDMELASVEFEKTNLKERAQDKEKVDKLDQDQNFVEKDHKKVINQQTKKKEILEDLKQRVLQAEKELDSLMDEELEINEAQEEISNKKLKLQHEIEEKLVKQHQDREHYLQLEELKFQSLQRVKKQYFLTQQEILHLEHEQKNILQGKKESESVGLKELAQLQEQRDLKQQMLDVLKSEYKQKNIELGEITKMQKEVQKDSTEEMKKLFALEV